MILSDREIQAAIDRRAFHITPRPDPVDCSSTALDLRLDEKLQVWRPLGGAGARVVVDPSNEEFNVTTLANQYAELVNCKNGYELEPGRFVLGWTLEAIQLPHTSRLAARVEGKAALHGSAWAFMSPRRRSMRDSATVRTMFPFPAIQFNSESSISAH
jgi:dCTP deaminase